MSDERRERALKLALAGLLHDVGKFAQRAGVAPEDQTLTKEDVGEHGYHALLSYDFARKYVPSGLLSALSGVLLHHRSDIEDPDVKIIQIADHLAAAERRVGSEEREDPEKARLIPILTTVTLKDTFTPSDYRYRLKPLDPRDEETIFPVLRGEDTDSYQELWQAFTQELDQWKKESQWNSQSLEVFYTTLTALLYKYTWCVPSATPWQKGKSEQYRRAYPDVSLYDHARIVSAIAACLAYDDRSSFPQPDEAIFLLVRGDVSGIQDFIYRISRPEATTEHIAKRLRGRSFYLQLQTELIVDWILRELGLPFTCSIFVGGGRFDLILPLSAEKALEELKEKLETWLLEAFMGEIGIWIAVEKATPEDLKDTSFISQRLNENIESIKQRKWERFLSNPSFYEPEKHNPQGKKTWHVCSVCQLTPMPESGQICDLCAKHERIGKYLPHTNYLIYIYDPNITLPEQNVIDFDFPKVQVAFVRHEKDVRQLLSRTKEVLISAINQTQNFVFTGVPCTFRFIANEAPLARRLLSISDLEVAQGDVLPFEAIADLSQGADRIGILMADVDNLGVLMSEGLREINPAKPLDQLLRPTLSRVATLSRTLDLFFAGYLNTLCKKIAKEWEQQVNNDPSSDGLFYIMYSGGDDLFIVGPWDQTLILAKEIREKFRKFCGNNPDLTLSAGYVQVKPRYPVHRFSMLVREAEGRAKRDGRNRIHLFGQSLPWADQDIQPGDKVSFEWLWHQAEDWIKAIAAKEINRGLIYDLGGLFRQHVDRDGKLKPLWTPRLYYTLARRLSQQALQTHQNNLLKVVASGKTLVPVSITSLKIRERR
ncbi:MAG: type III-A CRISPR-associated protein Cas10/Csm1 [Thermanaerothrix sp.]|uniref:type III-A CRISPR-associated protein Cas10/Csm1 n=1 Tax=Thermanaerothrix sp. TaxID=2972675 RepID=UPI003C7C60A1